MLPSTECIFSAKSFSQLEKSILLTNFQTLSTVYKDGKLMWLGGHFEKAAFSGDIDRFIRRC